MKKRILAMILAVIMVMPMAISLFAAEQATVTNYTKVEPWKNDAHKLSTMALAATSPDGNMLLYMDKASGEMAIKNLKTGRIVFTNPYDIRDSSLLNREKPYALSQLDLNYTVISSGEVRTLYSYNDCFIYGEASRVITSIDNGVKVDYTFGAPEVDTNVPFKIKAKDLEAILERAKPQLRLDVEKQYRADHNLSDDYELNELDNATIDQKTQELFEADRFQILTGCYIPYYGKATKGVDLSTLTEKDADGNEGQVGGDWPDNEFTKLVPKPEFEFLAANTDVCRATLNIN